MPWTAPPSLRLLAASTAVVLLAACRGQSHRLAAQGAMKTPAAGTSARSLPWPDAATWGRDIDSLYDATDRRFIWYFGGHLLPSAHDAIATLRSAPDDGLDDATYAAGPLEALARDATQRRFTDEQRTRFDRTLSAAFLAWMADVRHGRAAGAPPRVIAARDSARPALFEAMAAAARADTIRRLVRRIEPRVPEYEGLRTALARYRALAADPGIPAVPVPAALPVKAGDGYAGVTALRARLAALGDLPDAAAHDTASTHDSTLVAAVRRFQSRHGLAADGVIGRETLDALRTPLAQRVTQIALAMERIRRQPRPVSGRLIVVDVPAFELFAYDSASQRGVPSLEMKVVVGRTGTHETPSIDEELRYLDFWPYWNVPHSITDDEILPKLREDPSYLQRERMEVVAGRDRVVGDSVTDEVLAGLANHSLRIRQQPGPGNALGRVKFVIPNDSSIYLHDTPQKSYFDRTRRDLSHGCIRVEKPRALAAWALAGLGEWSADSLDRALEGPGFRRVMLAHPVPVIVEYNTALVRPDGTIWFVPDIYGRDAKLAAALREND